MVAPVWARKPTKATPKYDLGFPSVPALPQDQDVIASRQASYDYFYQLPNYVECLVFRANQELPKGFSCLPWTINRAVSLFHGTRLLGVVTYETIEADLVQVLDNLVSKAQAAQRGQA